MSLYNIKSLHLLTKSHFIIILIIFQTFWFLLLFPGCISYDSYNQISQALGFIPFSDNNPIFHSMLMAVVMRPLYIIFHSVDVCIAAWNFISNIYYFFVVLYSLKTFYNLFKENIFVKLILMFYSICPLVWGFWNILWKDVWISYSVVLLLTLIIDLLYISKYEGFAKNTFKLVLLFVTSILTLISKGTGILFVIPIEISLIFHFKKINKVIIMILISIILYFVSLNFVTKFLGFEEHSNIDIMCMFWQILGKILSDNDLSKSQEYNMLNNFIDIDKAKLLYNPYIADPIKESINIDEFNLDFIKNFLLVLKLTLKYYKSSLKAIACMVIGYLSPAYYRNQICTDSYLYTVYSYAHNKYNIVFDPNGLNITSDMINMEFRVFVHNIFGMFYHIPILSYFFNVGFYNTIWVVCLFFSIFKKYSIVVFTIPFFCFISCIMSPVSGELRYAYPMILCIPTILIYTFFIAGGKYGSK